MLTIHLHKLHFHSFHGLFPEEKMLGATFEVNADIFLDNPEMISQLDQTADYVLMYDIICEKMKRPTNLLETVAENIIVSIFEKDSRINKVSISIFKLNPPIKNFQGKLGVTLCKER